MLAGTSSRSPAAPVPSAWGTSAAATAHAPAMQRFRVLSTLLRHAAAPASRAAEALAPAVQVTFDEGSQGPARRPRRARLCRAPPPCAPPAHLVPRPRCRPPRLRGARSLRRWLDPSARPARRRPAAPAPPCSCCSASGRSSTPRRSRGPRSPPRRARPAASPSLSTPARSSSEPAAAGPPVTPALQRVPRGAPQGAAGEAATPHPAHRCSGVPAQGQREVLVPARQGRLG